MKRTTKQTTHTRQRILDFVIASGSVICDDVFLEFTEYSHDTIFRHMREMAGNGELHRIRNGKGMNAPYVYSAKSAVAARPNFYVPQHLEDDITDEVTTTIGSKTIHQGNKRSHPIKNQEGIGSGRQRVYVGCVSMGNGTGMA